jgi:hypothetical protein
MAGEMIAGEWMTPERERALLAELREHGSPCPNVVGLRCADFLSLLFGGLHNVRHASGPSALSRVDFSQSTFVELPIRCNLATTDGDTLTRIVWHAHDAATPREEHGWRWAAGRRVGRAETATLARIAADAAVAEGAAP